MTHCMDFVGRRPHFRDRIVFVHMGFHAALHFNRNLKKVLGILGLQGHRTNGLALGIFKRHHVFGRKTLRISVGNQRKLA